MVSYKVVLGLISGCLKDEKAGHVAQTGLEGCRDRKHFPERRIN